MKKLLNNLPFLLLVACASLYFFPLGGRALWNSDEGRYAEIAREMLVLKDWLSPHLNFVLYFEKPPLMYWLTAASLAVFGQNEFAARFWCAVFGVLTVGLTYIIGKPWQGERTGLLAGIFLATSSLYFMVTQYLVLDMALTFWMTLALLAMTHILMERPPERVRRATDLLAIAMAGGFLTKGIIAFLFPVAVLILTLAYTRLGMQARKIAWQPAFLLFLLLTAPWFVMVSLKNPIFPYFFFIREHILRFLTPVHHRTAPFYFFVPVLIAGFLPWSVFLPSALLSSFEHRAIALKRDPVKALLVIWTAFIFVFFSFSESKLAGYLLPVFPALALLLGEHVDQALEDPVVPGWVRGGVVSLILIFLAALVILKAPMTGKFLDDPIAATVYAHSDILALTLALAVFILVGVWGMGQTLTCLGGVMMVQVLLLGTLMMMAPMLDPYLSNRAMGRFLAMHAKPDEPIVAYAVSYEDVLQSLPFYSGRRIVVDGPPGELELGRDHAEDASQWFWTDPGAKDAMPAMPAGSWVITSDEAARYIRQMGALNSYEQIGREGRLLLFHKAR